MLMSGSDPGEESEVTYSLYYTSLDVEAMKTLQFELFVFALQLIQTKESLRTVLATRTGILDKCLDSALGDLLTCVNHDRHCEN